MKYIAEQRIVVEGFSPGEVAKAIHHCSRKVRESYVKELRRELRREIIIPFTHLLIRGGDDRSYLERLYQKIVGLSSAFSKSEPSLDHYIRTTAPTTLSNLSDGGGGIMALRDVAELLEEAMRLYCETVGKPRPVRHHIRSRAAGKLLKAEEIFTEQLINNLKEKFPEEAYRIVSSMRNTIKLLKKELEAYLDKASSEPQDTMQSKIESYF
ncbi:MAG: hypothetical protein QXW50_02410 [Nitrososphaerota archaeon]